MDNNFNSFNPASGADSASVQEQLVKGSLSSSNFNIVDELEEVDLLTSISTSMITAAAILPCSAAPITNTMKAAHWRACGWT